MTADPAPRRLDRPQPLATRLRMTLLRTSRKLRAEGAGRLPESHYSVLGNLFKEGPVSPGRLAELEHVRPPSMTRTLQALEAEGLIERTPHPGDRRQQLVGLSEQGREFVRETRRRRDQWLQRRLAALSPQERQTLSEAEEILRRMSQ